MESDRHDREALAAAGYTGPLGTLLLCLILGGLGALLGSVVFAILLSVAFPANSHADNVILGLAAGVALGIWISLMKVRQGNLDAREQVEDREWRRLVRREHFDRPQ
jgi:glucose-6-phosphate-specific signal transduction histidine kinase